MAYYNKKGIETISIVLQTKDYDTIKRVDKIQGKVTFDPPDEH